MDNNTINEIKEEILQFPTIQQKVKKIEKKLHIRFLTLFFTVFGSFVYASKNMMASLYNFLDHNIIGLIYLGISHSLMLFLSLGVVIFFTKIIWDLFRTSSFQQTSTSFFSCFTIEQFYSTFLTRKDLSLAKSIFANINVSRINIYQKEFKKINSEKTFNQKILIILIASFLKEENITYNQLYSYIKCIQSESLDLDCFIKSIFGYFINNINKNDFIENKSNILKIVNLIKNQKVKETIFYLYIEVETEILKSTDVQKKISTKLKELQQYTAKSKAISI